MTNLIRALDAIGSDASLHLRMRVDPATVIVALGLAGQEQQALLDGDRSRLDLLADARPIRCCSLEKHDDDEEQEAPDREDEEIRTRAAIAPTC